MAGVDRYRGQVALVTGGGSGIGRALGAELVRAGATVVLADVDADAVRVAAAQLAAIADGAVVEGIELDVRDRNAWVVAVHDVIVRHGRLDLLVNNAGIQMGGPSHELTGEHWDRIVDVNLMGVVNGVLATYPGMVAAGRGQIVNTASGAGLAAPPFVTAYAATKHAVVGLSTGLRPEAALHGVRVNVLCPGSIDTPILDRPPEEGLPATASAPVTGRQYLAVLRQRPTSPDDLARAALRRMAADQAIIVVPRQAKALWWFHRLSPSLLQRALRRIAAKVQRELIRPADAVAGARGEVAG